MTNKIPPSRHETVSGCFQLGQESYIQEDDLEKQCNAAYRKQPNQVVKAQALLKINRINIKVTPLR
jgi:hypothetical protein